MAVVFADNFEAVAEENKTLVVVVVAVVDAVANEKIFAAVLLVAGY